MVGHSAPELRDVPIGIDGLLPPHVEGTETRMERTYQAHRHQPTDLDKFVYPRQLQDTNEVLFYALAAKHVVEMAAIVYDPTVAQGIEQFHKVYRKPRGLFLSIRTNTPVNRDALLAAIAAEVALAAYRVALRARTEGTWLNLELDLWRALADTAKAWGNELPRCR